MILTNQKNSAIITKSSARLTLHIEELCNGSTTDSDSVCWGSNPYSAAKKKRQFSTEDCRFFLFSSLFSIFFSLLSKIVVSREKIREKKEEKR